LKARGFALIALALAFVCYTATWISGAVAFGVLGMIFEGAFWYSLLSPDSNDDDDMPDDPSSESLRRSGEPAANANGPDRDIRTKRDANDV
jgi:hypothetical protein